MKSKKEILEKYHHSISEYERLGELIRVEVQKPYEKREHQIINLELEKYSHGMTIEKLEWVLDIS